MRPKSKDRPRYRCILGLRPGAFGLIEEARGGVVDRRETFPEFGYSFVVEHPLPVLIDGLYPICVVLWRCSLALFLFGRSGYGTRLCNARSADVRQSTRPICRVLGDKSLNEPVP